MAYGRTRAEMETTIVFDAEEKIAHIYTADPVYIRRLDKLAAEHPDTYRMIWADKGDAAKKYTAPSRLIRFGKPASEARREAGRAMFAKLVKNSP